MGPVLFCVFWGCIQGFKRKPDLGYFSEAHKTFLSLYEVDSCENLPKQYSASDSHQCVHSHKKHACITNYFLGSLYWTDKSESLNPVIRHVWIIVIEVASVPRPDDSILNGSVLRWILLNLFVLLLVHTSLRLVNCPDRPANPSKAKSSPFPLWPCSHTDSQCLWESGEEMIKRKEELLNVLSSKSCSKFFISGDRGLDIFMTP